MFIKISFPHKRPYDLWITIKSALFDSALIHTVVSFLCSKHKESWMPKAASYISFTEKQSHNSVQNK